MDPNKTAGAVPVPAAGVEPITWKFKFPVGTFVRDPFQQRGYIEHAGVDRAGTIYLVRYAYAAPSEWWGEHVLAEWLPD
jgi:hypothetical protein